MLFSADWQSVQSLRSVLPPQAKTVAHWRNEHAAFLAASVPGKGICSVVRLEAGKAEIRFNGEVHANVRTRALSSLDLTGVVVGNNVVLFHTESRLASSAVSFDTGQSGAGRMRFIVTGLAPGMWEIWRDGWVVDIGIPVRAGEAVLAFEERPGSYFVRRLQ
jgi:hypothetical protein